MQTQARFDWEHPIPVHIISTRGRIRPTLTRASFYATVRPLHCMIMTSLRNRLESGLKRGSGVPAVMPLDLVCNLCRKQTRFRNQPHSSAKPRQPAYRICVPGWSTFPPVAGNAHTCASQPCLLGSLHSPHRSLVRIPSNAAWRYPSSCPC